MAVNKVDYSGLKLLQKQLELLKRTQIEAGFFSDSTYDGSGDKGNPPEGYNAGMYVAEVAVIQNYGEGVPKRGFMDDSWKHIRTQVGASILTVAVKEAFQNKSPDVYGDKVGKSLKTIIKDTIELWHLHDSNAASTIEQKGFDDPLQRTDTMLDSVDYRVIKRGKK